MFQLSYRNSRIFIFLIAFFPLTSLHYVTYFDLEYHISKSKLKTRASITTQVGQVDGVSSVYEIQILVESGRDNISYYHMLTILHDAQL